MIKAALLYSLLAGPTLLEGVDIHHPDGRIDTAMHVAFSGTKIISISKTKPKLADAKVIDARGKVLIPGIIESVSQLGLMEVGMVESTNDYGIESESPFNPSFDPSIAYNPLSTHIPINRRAGITHVVIAPRGGIISGIGRSAPLTGQLEERPKQRAETAVFARVGTRAAQGVGGSRAEIWRTLEEIVRDARYAERNARLLSRGEGRDTILSVDDLAVFSKVLKRALPLVVEAHQATDILNALDFAQKHKIRLVINGGTEAWLVRKELSDAKVPVIIYPGQIEPWGFEALAARDDLAAMLEASGIPVILSAGGWDQNARRLRQEAGIAVSYGLSRKGALAALTETPAEVFDLLDEVGTIRVGGPATFGLYSADPFELDTTLEALWITGRPQSLEDRQRALAKRYLDLKP